MPLPVQENLFYLTADAAGGAWVTSFDSGVYHVRRNGRITEFNPTNSIIPWHCSAIDIGPDGAKWVGTDNGVFVIRDILPLGRSLAVGASVPSQVFPACTSPNIVLQDQSTTIGDGLMRWRWTLPNGDTLSGREVRVGFAVPGTYRIALFVQDSNQSYADTAVYVTIVPGAGLAVVGPDTVRACAPVALRTSTTGTVSQIAWRGPQGPLAGSPPLAAGPGRYVVTASAAGCPLSDSVEIIRPDTARYRLELDSLPAGRPPALIDSATGTEAGAPVQAQLLPSAGLPPLANYAPWRFAPDGQAAGSAYARFYPAGLAGRLLAYGRGADSCPAVASYTVVVRPPAPPPPALAFYNVVTPNGDGRNDALLINQAPAAGTAPDRLKLFSRWGYLVYEAAPYQNGWPVAATTPAGTYLYIYEYSTAGKQLTHKGWVEVVR